MTRLVVDSYAWIEFLEGSAKGARVRRLLHEAEEALTPVPVVAEVCSKAARSGKDAGIAWRAMRGGSVILPLDGETARTAGALHAEIRRRMDDFALVDAVVLTIARKMEATVVTGDPHFRGMRGIIFLGQAHPHK